MYRHDILISVGIHFKQNDPSKTASVQSSKSPGLEHVQANVALTVTAKKCRSVAMSQDAVKSVKNPHLQVCRLCVLYQHTNFLYLRPLFVHTFIHVQCGVKIIIIIIL